MKKLFTYYIIFIISLSLCYSQENNSDNELKFESISEFSYIMGSSLITEKQDGKEYKLQSSLGGFSIRRYYGATGTKKDSSFVSGAFFGIGLSLMNFVSNYYSSGNNYVLKKKYLELPLLVTVRSSRGINFSMGFYGSWLLRASKKADAIAEKVDTFVGFNFGFMTEFALWYKISKSSYFSVGVPIKLEFARIYNSSDENIKIEPIWAINIGFASTDIISGIYHILL